MRERRVGWLDVLRRQRRFVLANDDKAGYQIVFAGRQIDGEASATQRGSEEGCVIGLETEGCVWISMIHFGEKQAE